MQGFENFPKFRRRACEALSNHLAIGMEREPTPNEKTLARNTLISLLNQDSISFRLPDDGKMVADDTPYRMPENASLRFPCCIFEYGMSETNGKSVIIVATQTEPGGDIQVELVLGSGQPDQLFFAMPTFLELYDLPSIVMNDEGKLSANYKIMQPLDLNREQWLLDKPDLERIFSICFRVILHFVMLCHCVGVKPVKIFEPSEKLVKRAQERGNLPLNEYWSLNIFTGANRKTDAESGGTHASPRFHVRRGHIRHLSDGRMILVRSCTVGDASLGRIIKDYNVLPAA